MKEFADSLGKLSYTERGKVVNDVSNEIELSSCNRATTKADSRWHRLCMRFAMSTLQKKFEIVQKKMAKSLD